MSFGEAIETLIKKYFFVCLFLLAIFVFPTLFLCWLFPAYWMLGVGFIIGLIVGFFIFNIFLLT